MIRRVAGHRSRCVFVLLLLGARSAGCVDPCGNAVVSEVYSPDRRLKAVVFLRDCGATAGVSTHLSVLDGSEALLTQPTSFRSTSSGNVFIADNVAVTVAWLEPARLRVTYNQDARVSRSEKHVDGVTVEYATNR
jgi:hypothetical protein